MGALLKELATALNYSEELLIASLILMRVVPMVLFTPTFGARTSPPEIKMGLAVLMTIVVWPAARASVQGHMPTSAIPFLMLIMKEFLVGFLVSWMIGTATLDVIGRFVDTARGTTMSEVIEPTGGSR